MKLIIILTATFAALAYGEDSDMLDVHSDNLMNHYRYPSPSNLVKLGKELICKPGSMLWNIDCIQCKCEMNGSSFRCEMDKTCNDPRRRRRSLPFSNKRKYRNWDGCYYCSCEEDSEIHRVLCTMRACSESEYFQDVTSQRTLPKL